MRLREVPPELRQYVRATKSRADLMGWSAADLRKAASAAVNGEFINPLAKTCTSPHPGDRVKGIGLKEAADSRSGTGTRLLTALVSRFGPAPGVRAKVGEYDKRSVYDGCTRNSIPINTNWRAAEGRTDTGDVSRGTITAPATPEAQQLDGWHGGAVPLKPMMEHVLWVTKPMDRKPIRENVKAWGVGGVNVEACRVPFEEGAEPQSRATFDGDKRGRNTLAMSRDNEHERTDYHADSSGRYPSNLLVTARALGDFSRFVDIDRWAEERGLDAEWLDAALEGIVRCTKPSRAEKNRGCEGLEEKVEGWSNGAQIHGEGYAEGQDIGYNRVIKRRNNHPTCKPVTLMAYLIALACPQGGTVLDCFCGSGTTCVAAKQLGMRYIGVDLSPEYCEIARARVAAAETPEPNLDTEAAG